MDILQQIIEMDKAAAARNEAMRKAELERLDAMDVLNRQHLEQVVKNERAQAKEFLAQRREKLEKKKADTEAELSERISRLDGIFDTHKDEWQSEIIARITGE